MALFSSFTCGIGNYIMGIKLIKAGPLGPGFTGPLGFFILAVLRIYELLRNKINHGSFINYKESNLFTKNPPHKFRKR